MDVNNGAAAAPAASSAAQGQTGSASPASPDTSAGTINTDQSRLPDSIPYARFKEVNDKAKTLEEQLKPFTEKGELYKTYEQFDEVLSSRPEIMPLVQIALTRPDVAAQILQNLGLGEQQAPQADPTVQQLVLTTYTNEFEKMAREANIAEELLPEYFEMTKNELLRINPNPLSRVNVNDVRTAFKNAQDRARKFTAPYQSSRPGGVPPSASATGGQPVPAVPEMSSQSERGRFIAEQLKSGLNF